MTQTLCLDFDLNLPAVVFSNSPLEVNNNGANSRKRKSREKDEIDLSLTLPPSAADYESRMSKLKSKTEISVERNEKTTPLVHAYVFLGSLSDVNSTECDLDEFSENSDYDSPPLSTHYLLKVFRREFQRSSFCLDKKGNSVVVDKADCFERFEDIDDEVSYQRLLERERRQLFLHNYLQFYSSTTEFGDLISEQRRLIVRWIIEYSAEMKFQQETVFLAVCLFDRFLSKGFFRTKCHLQLAGIACLTLAVRIVQNRPKNSIKQEYFQIGSGVYSRSKVVAMEWLVQEVLSFQCLLPTIYDFMWFYIKASQVEPETEERARNLALLALLDEGQLGKWPSAVAAASVIVAAAECNKPDCCKRVIRIHSRTKEDNLPGCAEVCELASFQIRKVIDGDPHPRVKNKG